MEKVEKLYAFLLCSSEGEVIPCFNHHNFGRIPLFGGDMRHVDSLRKVAQNISSQTGKSIRLCVFESRREIEVINPE